MPVLDAYVDMATMRMQAQAEAVRAALIDVSHPPDPSCPREVLCGWAIDSDPLQQTRAFTERPHVYLAEVRSDTEQFVRGGLLSLQRLPQWRVSWPHFSEFGEADRFAQRASGTPSRSRMPTLGYLPLSEPWV